MVKLRGLENISAGQAVAPGDIIIIPERRRNFPFRFLINHLGVKIGQMPGNQAHNRRKQEDQGFLAQVARHQKILPIESISRPSVND